MKKYLLSVILLVGCANPEYQVAAETLPKSTVIATFSGYYRLERYHDTTTNVVCYKMVGGSALSCVPLNSTK